jgi:Domain of unknown function (DUF4386)
MLLTVRMNPLKCAELLRKLVGRIDNIIRVRRYLAEKRNMHTDVILDGTAKASPSFRARMAGVLFSFSALAAIFGEFFVRRFEIEGDLIAVLGMVAVTLILYTLFRPVNRSLSLLAASLNLVGLTCGALRWNPRGVDLPVVFDGFSCLLLGYLIYRSNFLPRILGALMHLLVWAG